MDSQPSYSMLKDMEVVLRSKIDDNSVFEDVVQGLSMVLSDYEISKKCYALTTTLNENIRILNNYKACLLVEGKSEQTIEAYEYRIKHLLNTSKLNFKDMGPYDIRLYLAICKQNGCSNRTLDTIRCYLSAFFKWMKQEGLIDANPCDAIKPIKYASEIRESFNELEIEKLRSCCKNDKERAILELLLSSGIRVSELTNMNVSDIDFQSNTVKVQHGKGDRGRTTYLSPVAAYYIVKYLDNRKDSGVELFRSASGRLQTGGVRWMLKDLGERAGVEDVHPHKFRRTFATTLNRRGMPIQDIQNLLGHSSIDTTMVYVKLNKDAVRSEYEKFMVS